MINVDIALATHVNYRRDMNRIVLPAFHGYSLRDIGVARCDALLEPQPVRPLDSKVTNP